MMSRLTSWQQDEDAVDARPSFRPTFHIVPGMTKSSNKPRPMPVRLCAPKPQVGRHGQKSPQPQRVPLKYGKTPQGHRVVRRNIENQQFELKQITASVGSASKRKFVSGIKIPIPGNSKPQALKQLDVNRSESVTPKLTPPKCLRLSSPLLSLEDYAPRIAGQANAFKTSQEIRNGNKYDLRNIALRNASIKKLNSTITSAATNIDPNSPLVSCYSRAIAKIPDSPKLLFSARKTSAIETQAIDYLDKLKLSKIAKTQFTATSAEKKQELTLAQTGMLNNINYKIDVSTELQTMLTKPGLQCTPVNKDFTEETTVSSELLQYKRDESICLKSSPDSSLKNIIENEAKKAIINKGTEMLTFNKSFPNSTFCNEFLTLIRSFKEDQEKQVEIHRKLVEIYREQVELDRKQVDIHRKLGELQQEAMEVCQKNMKSCQDIIELQLIPLPTQVTLIPETICEKDTLHTNIEPQSTTKKRRSLRIAARRSGGICVSSPVDVNVRTEDWINQSTFMPSTIITNPELDQNVVIQMNNVNKTLPLKTDDNSEMKTLAKNRRSLSKYRMLQSSFSGFLKTPMKTPITKSARKMLPNVIDTPTEISRRVQASLELLHDDDTVN